jgi:hypothetical protein
MSRRKERACFCRLRSMSWRSIYGRNGRKAVNKRKTWFWNLNAWDNSKWSLVLRRQRRGKFHVDMGHVWRWSIWNGCRCITRNCCICDTLIVCHVGRYELASQNSCEIIKTYCCKDSAQTLLPSSRAAATMRANFCALVPNNPYYVQHRCLRDQN